MQIIFMYQVINYDYLRSRRKICINSLYDKKIKEISIKPIGIDFFPSEK